MSINYAGSEYLTAQEAARVLRITDRTLYRWVQDGRLTCFYTPTGMRRFLAADVERLLERRSA